MLFQIVAADTGTPIPGVTFASAQEAQAARPIYEMETGKKLRIAKVTTGAWRLREEMLFANGTRKPLPVWWQESQWWIDNAAIYADHFLHMSVKQAGKLAFTESPEKGDADIQTPISASRYLARFFSEVLRPEEIANIAARFEAGEIEAKIASTPDAFQDVYRRAVSVCAENSSYQSCMCPSFRNLPHHPAYIYGAGDLAIAWIERENMVIARAVIWPNQKSFVRLYGDTKTECQALRAYLEGEGYSQCDHFEGARLLKIATHGEYLMPYIDAEYDSHKSCEDMGDHFVIACEGEIDATNTNGVCNYSNGANHCEACGDRIGRHDEQYSVQDSLWCESCYENNTFYCDYTEETYPDSYGCETVIVRRMHEQVWNYRAARDHAFRCDNTDALYCEDDFTSIEVETATGTQIWCGEATNGDFFDDAEGNYFASDDFTPIEVITGGGSLEVWCKEKTQGEYFICEACGVAHENALMGENGMCKNCTLQGATPQGKVNDETQMEIAL